ncbi:MAG: dihydropteroate synthase [Candidatus Melainabacteria bacterium]|nr:dihydropteroate synthase [Candidatus Melainabacteria bacterium]
MINDVSGLTKDPDMIKIASEANCKVIIMHNKGIPATKPEVRSKEAHTSVIEEVYNWLEKQTNFAIENGIKRENIIIDPGIGFGKTPEEDLFLIENLQELKSLGFSILIGSSKKSFIKKLFGDCDIEKKNQELTQLAINNGADILRIHQIA